MAWWWWYYWRVWHGKLSIWNSSDSQNVLYISVKIWQFLFHVSDAAVAVLILFVYNLLRLLSSVSPSQPLLTMAECCPKSLYSVHKMIGLVDNQFLEYVVCPQCHSIYKLSQCIQQDSHGRKTSKRCWYIKFPNYLGNNSTRVIKRIYGSVRECAPPRHLPQCFL